MTKSEQGGREDSGVSDSQEGHQAHQSMWPCSQISKFSVEDLYVTVAGAVHGLGQCTLEEVHVLRLCCMSSRRD